jgi:hypothetical protein
VSFTIAAQIAVQGAKRKGPLQAAQFLSLFFVPVYAQPSIRKPTPLRELICHASDFCLTLHVLSSRFFFVRSVFLEEHAKQPERCGRNDKEKAADRANGKHPHEDPEQRFEHESRPEQPRVTAFYRNLA